MSLDSLKENKTWDLVEPSHDKKLVSNRWVLRIKKNPDGSVDCNKARLVARGFDQVVLTSKTFSPVVRFDSIRVLITISVVAQKSLYMQQFDIKTAFLYGELQGEVFMSQPLGFSDGTDRVCKLNASVYGLKQAHEV